MRKRLTMMVTLVASLTGASTAFAQVDTRAVPRQGMLGVGFTLSAAVPTDETLDTGSQIGFSADTYLSRRVSIRGLVAASWLDVTGHSFSGSASPVTLNGSVVYNWERGRWHPFVTGGVGFHYFRFDDGGLDGNDTKVGVSFGGGTELFLTRRDTIVGEFTYHAMRGQVISPLTRYDPSFWTISGGYKKYFN